MIRPKYLFAIASLFTGISAAWPQDLNTQITVHHEVVPEERAASRLRMLPTVSLPTINPGRLPAASMLRSAELTPFISALNPAPYATSQTPYPWRGYAALAYGPVYNLGASAGYTFVDNDKISANAFLQFNGQKYTSEHPDKAYRGYGSVGLRNNSLALGADTHWRPLKSGSLAANVLYRYSAYNFPLPILNQGIPYTDPKDCVVSHNDIDANMLDVDLLWKHQPARKFTYTVNAGYGLHKFGQTPGAMCENQGKAAIKLIYDHGKVSHWSLNAGMDLLSTTANGSSRALNKGLVDIHPSYLLTLKRFSAAIGVKISLETGNFNRGSDLKAYLYPELNLLWQPSAYFNLYGRMDGRTDLNSLASLYEAQPYFFPTMTPAKYNPQGNFFRPSHICNYEIGTNIGPFKGASLMLFAGIDMADEWLMPAYAAGYFSPRDVVGSHFGLKASYTFRSYLDISAKLVYAYSPDDDFDKGYYLWRDHARWDLAVKATVRPVKQLAIGLSYHMRTHRAKPVPGIDGLSDSSQYLGDIHDLNASVSYNITRQWTVFINGENLIDHRYYLGPAIPSQGIRGMLGAAYKF